jgi:hypothetical protein
MTWDVKNIVERAFWTFIQAGVGSLPATLALSSNNAKAAAWAFVTAGVAAVISLAKNLTAEGIVVQAAKRAGTTTP